MSTLHAEFANMVSDLKKPGVEIRRVITPIDCDLIHMVLGISGEAGELLDAIKKYTVYRKPIDLPNIIEELGDLEFYMEGIRQVLDIDRDSIIQANMDKLEKRYKGFQYSDQQAIDRADKT